ncbi:hypothetical protein ABIB30_004178 [Pedobacter sp. UYP1]
MLYAENVCFFVINELFFKVNHKQYQVIINFCLTFWYYFIYKFLIEG